MPISLPFPILITIYQTDGVTPVSSGVSVYCRNESTNEVQEVQLTDSNGQVMFDGANFTQGYLTTDTATVFVAYDSLEGSISFPLNNGSYTGNFTLTAVGSSSTVYYCTVQDVWDNAELTSTDVSAQKVIKYIKQSESIIDRVTGSSFKVNTVTNEIYPFNQFNAYMSPENVLGSFAYNGRYDIGISSSYANEFMLNNSPIISITSLDINQVASGRSADSWLALTQNTGAGGDYILDQSIGKITFLGQLPKFTQRSIRVSYTWGYSTVPKEVKQLCTLLTVKQVLRVKMNSSASSGMDSISLPGISITHMFNQGTEYMRNLDLEIDRLWGIVGQYKSKLVGN